MRLPFALTISEHTISSPPPSTSNTKELQIRPANPSGTLQRQRTKVHNVSWREGGRVNICINVPLIDLRYTLRLPVPPSSSPPPALPGKAPRYPGATANRVNDEELDLALALSLQTSAPGALTIRMIHPQGSSKVKRSQLAKWLVFECLRF